MLEFGKGETTTLQRLVKSFIVAFERDVVDVLASELRGIQPARVVEVREELTLLLRQLELKPKQMTLHDVHRPLLKRILVDERRRAAESVEEPLGKSLAKGSLCGITGPRYDERDASFESLRPPKSS